jgi:hypothetical protein
MLRPQQANTSENEAKLTRPLSYRGLFDLFSNQWAASGTLVLDHGQWRERNDMRIVILIFAMLYSATAIAQDKPPAAAGKPPAQTKSKAAPAKQKPQSTAAKLQGCLEFDDATKEQLNCYDAIFRPAPKPKAPAAKGVTDCRFIKEEDERLTCFNGFVEKIPKLPN